MWATFGSWGGNNKLAIMIRCLNKAWWPGYLKLASSGPVYVAISKLKFKNKPKFNVQIICSIFTGLFPYRVDVIAYVFVWAFIICIASEREKIFDAMQHWEESTCIRFYPLSTYNSTFGVNFRNSSTPRYVQHT